MTSGGEIELLSRRHHIPLRRQLAAGLEAAIRDGHISPGAALPSTRDLARRLEIHRGTVGGAYARLRRRRCISGGPGRRKVAAARGERTPSADLELRAAGMSLEAVRSVLGSAFEAGVEREEILRALRRALAAPIGGARPRPSQVFLLEPRPGLRRILARELETELGLSVRSGSRFSAGAPGLPQLARREVVGRLAEGRHQVPPTQAPLDLIPLDLAGGTRERGIVRHGVRRGLVLLVSVSACVRRYASELAAREYGRGVSFAAIDPADEEAVVRTAAAARLVLFDAASTPALPLRARQLEIRVLSRGSLDSLRGYLGLTAGRLQGSLKRTARTGAELE